MCNTLPNVPLIFSKLPSPQFTVAEYPEPLHGKLNENTLLLDSFVIFVLIVNLNSATAGVVDGVGVGVFVGVGLGLAFGVNDGVGDAVTDGVALGVAVGLGVTVGVVVG